MQSPAPRKLVFLAVSLHGWLMTRYLRLAGAIFSKWRIWLKRQIIADVPTEDAICEFDCRKSECRFDDWARCKNRLDYLKLTRRAEAERNGGRRVGALARMNRSVQRPTPPDLEPHAAIGAQSDRRK